MILSVCYKTFFALFVVILCCVSTFADSDIPADQNADGKVNIVDFSYLSSDWQNMYDQEDLSRFNFHWMMDSSLNDKVAIEFFYTDKARYQPGQNCTITAYCKNTSWQYYTGDLRIYISANGKVVHTDSVSISLGALTGSTKLFNWITPTDDFQGYLVEAWLNNAKCAVTAVDVSSDWKRYPRYGYITEFDTSTTASRNTQIMNNLSRDYHINSLQYYDWMWRHENIIKTNTSGHIESTWTDWSGTQVSYSILQDSIAKAQNRNMAAMPYFQVYIGLDDYESISSVSPEWGLYSDTSAASQYHHSAGSTNFWLFDPSNNLWQQHLFGQYTAAMLALNWDGLHLDQLGNIGNGTYYNYSGNPVNLSQGLKSIVDESKEHLNYLETAYSQLQGKDALMFNIVNGGIGYWAVDNLLGCNSDIVFSEIWDLRTYDQLSDFARYAETTPANLLCLLPMSTLKKIPLVFSMMIAFCSPMQQSSPVGRSILN